MKYLDEQKDCLIVDWPILSQDLNIIESIWFILKANVFKHKCNVRDALLNVSHHEWYLILNDTIYALYKSIRKRIEEV